MPQPKGEQFKRLYRGLAGVNADEIDTKKIGSHWTSNPTIAYNYATSRDVEGYPQEEGDMRGTVLEAMVHRRHIVDPESEEGEAWTMMGVLGPEHIEQEKTVRPGGIIHMKKMIEVDDDADTYKELPVQSRGWRA